MGMYAIASYCRVVSGFSPEFCHVSILLCNGAIHSVQAANDSCMQLSELSPHTITWLYLQDCLYALGLLNY